MAVMCELTRGFHPVLSPSYVAKYLRPREVFLQCRGKMSLVCLQLVFAKGKLVQFLNAGFNPGDATETQGIGV